MATKIIDTGKGSFIQAFECDNCDMVNPITYFEKVYTPMFLDFNRVKSYEQFANASYKERMFLENRLKMLSKEEWKVKLTSILETVLQPELLNILQEKRKKKQQKLLNSIEFRSELISTVAIIAWKRLKMPYSRFIVDYNPKELNGKIFPEFIYKSSDTELLYKGYTNLTKGEMKLAIDKRHRVVSDFIGDEHNWHCFFRTMSGVNGTEAPHIGEPHIHYISSAWEISRKDVIQQLLSYRYKLRAETIPLIL